MLDEFAPAAEREFVLDMCLVCFDRLYAEVKFFGDLPCAAGFANLTEYLKFAIRESGETGL